MLNRIGVILFLLTTMIISTSTIRAERSLASILEEAMQYDYGPIATTKTTFLNQYKITDESLRRQSPWSLSAGTPLPFGGQFIDPTVSFSYSLYDGGQRSFQAKHVDIERKRLEQDFYAEMRQRIDTILVSYNRVSLGNERIEAYTDSLTMLQELNGHERSIDHIKLALEYEQLSINRSTRILAENGVSYTGKIEPPEDESRDLTNLDHVVKNHPRQLSRELKIRLQDMSPPRNHPRVNLSVNYNGEFSWNMGVQWTPFTPVSVGINLFEGNASGQVSFRYPPLSGSPNQSLRYPMDPTYTDREISKFEDDLHYLDLLGRELAYSQEDIANAEALLIDNRDNPRFWLDYTDLRLNHIHKLERYYDQLITISIYLGTFDHWIEELHDDVISRL